MNKCDKTLRKANEIKIKNKIKLVEAGREENLLHPKPFIQRN